MIATSNEFLERENKIKRVQFLAFVVPELNNNNYFRNRDMVAKCHKNSYGVSPTSEGFYGEEHKFEFVGKKFPTREEVNHLSKTS